MKNNLVIFIIVLFCTVNLFPSSDVPKTIFLTQRTEKSAIVRSLLLPGWGQFYLRQTGKGYIYSTGVILGLVGGVIAYNKAEKKYDDYENKGIKGGELYDDYVQNTNYMYYSFGAGALIWIYSIIDAYVTVKKEKKEKFSIKRRNKFSFNVDHNKIVCNIKI
ncbi:DUF5683 domain-containing protein [bacterium]